MARGKDLGQVHHHAQRGGDHPDPEPPRQANPRRPHFILHRARIGHDPPRPVQHPGPFRGQPLKPAATPDQLHAKLFLQLLDRARQARLGNTAHFGSPAEMPLIGQGDEHFQLVDHPGLRLVFRKNTPAGGINLWQGYR